MTGRSFIIFLVFAILIVSSCKERFEPQLKPSQTNFLVVEGYINANGPTTIALSRSLPLKDSSASLQVENFAQLNVIGDDGFTFNLSETENGIYTSDSVNLNKNVKYKLRIQTADGRRYESELLPVQQTPPIDSVNWRFENNGVRIYVNSHDPSNTSQYYKWDYTETWELHSTYESHFAYENGYVRPRDPSETVQMFACWQTQSSSTLLVGSTNALSNNVVSMQPVTSVPNGSEKTGVRYSIVVRQASLDRRAYDFYQLMKKNTESLGSIFDPLPSEITGNITCVSNPTERVIGYVGVSTVAQKRIFISQAEIPGAGYYPDCTSTNVPNSPDSIRLYFEVRMLRPYSSNMLKTVYYAAPESCSDCRLRGTNVKPAFW
jgi:hypothetical protein